MQDRQVLGRVPGTVQSWKGPSLLGPRNGDRASRSNPTSDAIMITLADWATPTESDLVNQSGGGEQAFTRSGLFDLVNQRFVSSAWANCSLAVTASSFASSESPSWQYHGRASQNLTGRSAVRVPLSESVTP